MQIIMFVYVFFKTKTSGKILFFPSRVKFLPPLPHFIATEKKIFCHHLKMTIKKIFLHEMDIKMYLMN